MLILRFILLFPMPRFLKTKKAKPITILLIIRKNHGIVLKSKRIILLTRRVFICKEGFLRFMSYL